MDSNETRYDAVDLTANDETEMPMSDVADEVQKPKSVNKEASAEKSAEQIIEETAQEIIIKKQSKIQKKNEKLSKENIYTEVKVGDEGDLCNTYIALILFLLLLKQRDDH